MLDHETRRDGTKADSEDEGSGREGSEHEGSEIDRLRAEIVNSRRRLGSSLLVLEHRVEESVDWRHWVRAHPLTTLAASALAGYVIGRWGQARGQSRAR